MYSKQDFSAEIEKAFLKRELTAALYHAGDPRILQIQESMATMFAMLSQQVEVAAMEPFLKSRDATVLADAALKGLIFTATPSTQVIKVTNKNTSDINIQTGRILLDSNGRQYSVIEPKSVVAGEIAEIKATQINTEVQSHQIDESYPFYEVEVEQPTDGSYISGLSVRVNDELFTPAYKFNGVGIGDKVYHVESDEFKRLTIKFGADNYTGYQVQQGDRVSIEKTTTFGDIQNTPNTPFSLQYVQQEEEHQVILEALRLDTAGTDPVDIATLRNLVKYPSLYDTNAVFLGEFDMLLRSKFHNLAFLRVWNEAEEEIARGAKVENINTLFVSFALPEGSSLIKSAVENQIKSVISVADDSYKVRFVEPVIEKVSCSITAVISRMYDSETVIAQIKGLLLSQYGKNAFAAKQGKIEVKHKGIADLIRSSVQAISDQNGDFYVSVSPFVNRNPEVFRYMDENSIQVIINTESYQNTQWHG